MRIYCSYYHTILYLCIFVTFKTAISVVGSLVSYKGTWHANGMWKSTGKKELQTKQLAFVRPRPARDERLWKRLRRWEDRMREAPDSRRWFRNGFNHIFNFTIRIIVLRQGGTLCSHNATFCFYYSENKWEYMRISVISNQWIKPGGQS